MRRIGILIGLGVCLGLAWATAPTGNIRGTVVDEASQGLAGVQLLLTRDSDGVKASQATGEGGAFEFKELQAGVYTLEATQAAYQPQKLEKIELKEGETKQLALRLTAVALDAKKSEAKLDGARNKDKEASGELEPPRQDAAPPVNRAEAELKPGRDAFVAPSADLPATSTSLPMAAPVSGVESTEEVDELAAPEPRELARRASSLPKGKPKMQPQAGPADQPALASTDGEFNTEDYARLEDNGFLAVAQNPLSTFSIDVDTASYSNVRRLLQQGAPIPPDAVRIEELINYFPYSYPQPTGEAPFSVNVEAAAAPWELSHRLVRIGLKGRELDAAKRPALNLVFLLDVSGSMDEPNKLPLVKDALGMLAGQLGERDRVAIVVYAGASGLVLPPTRDKHLVLEALARLQAGGSTNGGEGLELAYQVAQQGFVEGGANRVILCTDGDFNVGTTSQGDLTRLIERKAKGGVFLSVLGFGMGNYKDSTLEKLADKGNGNYAYIDTRAEARKVLVEQMLGTLVTIAKDVKIQVEFNPALVGAYRLIGYENRMLRAEDFNNDKKDAGEIGAGHTVTALYEIVPPGLAVPTGKVDPLKYQKPVEPSAAVASGELLTVKLRYKQPQGDVSQLIEQPVTDAGKSYDQASGDFKFVASVAAFGMLLRDSPYKAGATFDAVLELGEEGKGEDREGYRAEFLGLAKIAATKLKN